MSLREVTLDPKCTQRDALILMRRPPDMTIDRKESLSHVAPLVLHPIILRGKYGNKTDMEIRRISRDTYGQNGQNSKIRVCDRWSGKRLPFQHDGYQLRA